MITSFKATTAKPFAASPTRRLTSPKPDASQCSVCTVSSASLFSKLSLHEKTSVTAKMSTKNGVGLTYKDAGVDIDAGSKLVRRIAKMAPGIGGFGGLFPLGDSFLVAGTDGVGTKLKLAFETGIHDTIGIDLVAMSVNDIVTSGAKPLFFLDYFATSRLDVDLAEKVIKGIVDGCQQSDCVLLGGETAEMPDFYAESEYDLSGFAVGIVKKDSVIDGKNIVAGDVLIGLPSSGVHSNGFSLVRRVLAHSGLSLKDRLPGEAITLGEALIAPTVIYVKQVLDLISKGGVKGIAHVTGGGFTDNIPRVFPKGLGAVIYKDSWDCPTLFKWIQEERCAAADTLSLVARMLHRSKSRLQSMLLQSNAAVVEDFYVHLVDAVPDLTEHIHRTTARQLLHINGYVDRISNAKWEVKELGLEHNGYVDLLLGEFKHYKTRLAHGGIRKEVQDVLSEYGIEIVAETLVEGLSRVKRCTDEGRALMSLDLQVLINGLQHIVTVNVKPKLQMVETFIKAYYLPETEFVHWSRAHPEYTRNQIVGLINLVASMKGWKRKTRFEILEKIE